MRYNLAVCGGTFDHLHKGHKEFLRFALSLSKKLLIGLTSDKYVLTNNKTEGIDSYKIRRQRLEEFLRKEKAIERVSIAPIDNIFIPKVWEFLRIEAIIVSENTVSGAKEINLKRKEQGKYALKIEVATLFKSRDNEYISSSRIRNGEINREGRPYIKPLWFHQDLVLTEKLREELKNPFGELIKGEILLPTSRDQDDKKPYLITVGDITTKTFNKLHLNQNISVVDFKVARQKEFSSIEELGFSGGEKIFKVNNPAGCITPELFEVVIKIFNLKSNNRRTILQIEGEEDLSVLPLIATAPLGSIIFYGQPNEGVVRINVSQKSKESAYNLLSQFSIGTRGH